MAATLHRNGLRGQCVQSGEYLLALSTFAGKFGVARVDSRKRG